MAIFVRLLFVASQQVCSYLPPIKKRRDASQFYCIKRSPKQCDQKKQFFLLKQDLKIEGDMWTEFFLVRHSKFAPSCHLLKKVESHHKSTAKKGSPNSVTDLWAKMDQNRAFLACFRPCNDPCMTIEGIFLLSCLISSYMNTLSSLLPAGCSRTGRYSLQKGPWRITGGRESLRFITLYSLVLS